MNGKLIVLEGVDSSGKSTQIKQITKYLEKNNLTYDFLHFPKYGHNEFSEVIAKFLRGEFGGIDDVNPYFVANIFAMDQFLYKPELLQKLEDNDVVLLDRYVFSNIAFQGAKFDNPMESGNIQTWISDFAFEFNELPYPDLTLFLDVPIDIVKDRLKERKVDDDPYGDRDYLQGKQDIHEADLNFQSKVRDIYLSLEKATNYHTIDCAIPLDGEWYVLSPEDLFNSYKELIKITIDV